MCNKIEALLKEKIGLDVSSVGVASVQNAIKRCLIGSNYEDLDQYYKALLDSEAEFKRLVEAVIIPETWFFRDEAPFDVLARNANSRWLMSKDSSRMLRVLSIPCSTGEEPYTIAMALDKIGFPAERMQIDAVDISQHSIDKAKDGVYRENSFRSEDLSFRNTYFIKVADGYRLKSRIRNLVNFQQGNFIRDDFSKMKERYDVVFCRNLLIYFDSEDQQAAVQKLYDLIAPDGMLFVGHAEANNNVNHLFRSLRLRGAFAFVKKSDGCDVPDYNYGERFSEFEKKHGAITPVQSRRASASLVNGKEEGDRPFSAYIEHHKLEDQMDEQTLVAKARGLADEGALDEAEKLCQEILSRFSNADAYYLLGVVYEASSKQELAESMLRKSIYLAPNHTEALVHLALHVERNGNNEEALSLRRRAERAEL